MNEMFKQRYFQLVSAQHGFLFWQVFEHLRDFDPLLLCVSSCRYTSFLDLLMLLSRVALVAPGWVPVSHLFVGVGIISHE